MLSGEDAATCPVGNVHTSNPIDKLPLVSVHKRPTSTDGFGKWKELDNAITRTASTGRVSLVKITSADCPKYKWDPLSLSAVTRRNVDGAPVWWHCKCRGYVCGCIVDNLCTYKALPRCSSANLKNESLAREGQGMFCSICKA